jgi:hypothetical protein
MGSFLFDRQRTCCKFLFLSSTNICGYICLMSPTSAYFPFQEAIRIPDSDPCTTGPIIANSLNAKTVTGFEDASKTTLSFFRVGSSLYTTWWRNMTLGAYSDKGLIFFFPCNCPLNCYLKICDSQI